MARPLKIGLILPHWTDGLDGMTPRWRDLAALARAAEDVGLDSLWLIDDLLVRFDDGRYTKGVWEGWSCLVAVAAVTSHAQIGTLVTCNNFRNPALLAKMADTVDEISDGRLILGLGAGGDSGEHHAFGAPWERRFDRLEEALQLIRPLLRERHVDFEGRYYRARDCEILPRGPRPDGPPIMIGTVSAGPRLLGLTARFADLSNVWMAFGQSRPSAVAPLREATNAACRAIGRDPATLGRTAAIGLVSRPGHRLRFGPWDLTDGALAGSADELAEALRGFAREGIGHVQLFLAPSTVAGIQALGPVLERLDRA